VKLNRTALGIGRIIGGFEGVRAQITADGSV